MSRRLPRVAFNLRLRLLTSYLLMLTVTLGVIALALFVLIGNRAAPPEPTFARLAALTQGLNYIDFVADIPVDRDSPFLQERVHELLEVFARTRNVRAMQIRVTADGTRVVYDSSGTYSAGDALQLQRDSYKNRQLAKVLSRGSEQIFGRFRDPGGGEWLYCGVMFGRPGHLDRHAHDDLWLLAEPSPKVSLQETLAVFGNALAPPLLQAGVVGILFALLLAALISRTIAQPLQRLAGAATDVAGGDYAVIVPVSGPAEVRTLAESFNRMTTEVLAANTAQRDFLGNVSHDLKTPLTSIQGYAQAIMDGAADQPAEAARIIFEEASRLNRMVVELTDLERLQAGKLSMKSDTLRMERLSEAVVQRLAVVAEQKDIALDASAAPTPAVIGDGDRLAQVLVNLISNALKYTPPGGAVHVATEAADDGVSVSIRDNGIGIARDDLARVFERFYQVDKARGPQRGTGLGLAIAREIVEAHGGRITVESRGRGQGAVFRVWLPRARVGAYRR
ncbi:MAG: HAMP domain-containing histidine kinase [Chloroflexi bacterium]|nr:HAMP domain-containing histidine kinase [Chloroflexota bacterium]